MRVLAPDRLAQWEAQFRELANRMAAALPIGQPIDLMTQYAQPWSLAVAGIAAEVPEAERERLSGVARSIFDAAGEPFDRALEMASRRAAGELARFFQGAPALHLQMFVALAHSLPAFLGNAWLALLENPAAMASLRQDAALLPKVIDELLRLAGPARAQFRRAVATTTIAGCEIAPQQWAIVRLDVANRDPGQFPDPDNFRFDRRSGSHLAFGGGVHACVAATLIQSAAAAATQAVLAQGVAGPYCAVPADCFGVRYLRSLIVG
jgi:cytochrome P450